MVAEHHHFWNNSRKAKAKRLNLTKEEVVTLASIVEKETLQKSEQPVLQVCTKRLKKSMKLQSDPTVIFAIGDFSIRRVLKKDLKYDSPYNTYKYKGLPLVQFSSFN